MKPITDEAKEIFFRKKLNANIMRVVFTIIAAVAESGIDENWCLLKNQSTCKAHIDGKYLSNVTYYTDVKYLLTSVSG